MFNVSIIVSMYNKGYSARYIAKYLNIPLKNVYNKLVEEKVVPIAQLENRQFDDEDIISIYNMYNSGLNLYRVAQAFDTDRIVITDILNRRSYKDVCERHNLEVTKAYNRNGAFDYKVASLVLAANDNFPIMDIADIFDLPRPTIGNIFRAYKVKAVDARRLVNQGRKLTEEDVLAIFSMRKENHSLQKIADRFDISRQLVNNILQGKVYVDVSEKYTLI